MNLSKQMMTFSTIAIPREYDFPYMTLSKWKTAPHVPLQVEKDYHMSLPKLNMTFPIWASPSTKILSLHKPL